MTCQVHIFNFMYVCIMYVFHWLKDDFLKYLTDWENEAKVGCVGSELKYHHFTLSTQTSEGIKITGKYLKWYVMG